MTRLASRLLAAARSRDYMSRGARHAVIFLFLLNLALAAGNLFWTSHVISANQAAQRRTGQVFERKLCKTLSKLSARQPPPGGPKANPSRAYLQWQHGVLAELGPDVGCPAHYSLSGK